MTVSKRAIGWSAQRIARDEPTDDRILIAGRVAGPRDAAAPAAGPSAALGPSLLDSHVAADFVMNAEGTRLYIAGTDGNLRVYDLATRALLATWDIGTRLGGIDISRDGSFLMVTEQELPAGSGANTSLSYRVDAATGQSVAMAGNTRYIGQQDVAILADNMALVTPAYYPPLQDPVLWQINPATGQYTGQWGPPLTGRGTLLSTRDGGYVVHFPSGTSEGPLYLHQVGRGNVAGHDNYDDGVTGDNRGIQAVSGEAGLVAQHHYYDQIHIYRLEGLTHVVNLTTLGQFWPDVAGMAFDAAGRYLFILQSSTDRIYQLSIADWSIVRTIEVGADVTPISGNDVEFGNNLLISQDGRFITVNTGASVQLIELAPFADTLIGTAGADSLTAGAADSTLLGMRGNDVLTGGIGNDILDGGIGDDQLNGGAGNDRLLGALGADQLTGGEGADFLNGGIGVDMMTGGIGDDIYVVDEAGDLVVEGAAAGTDEIQTTLTSFSLGSVANVENLTGLSNVNATLTGTAGANVIRSGGGFDTLAGGAGDDIYYINDAQDVVAEGLGQGHDIVYARASWTMTAGQYVELLTGAPDMATTDFELRGNELGNLIVGNSGFNSLYGNAGDDRISGGGGNDRLIGGSGSDRLEGGAGSDFFAYNAVGDSFLAMRSDGVKFMPDVIMDFTPGQDWIDLSAMDANLATPGNDSFAFIGTNAFTGVAGQLRYESHDDFLILLGDCDGNGGADFQVVVLGAATLHASDFVL